MPMSLGASRWDERTTEENLFAVLLGEDLSVVPHNRENILLTHLPDPVEVIRHLEPL